MFTFQVVKDLKYFVFYMVKTSRLSRSFLLWLRRENIKHVSKHDGELKQVKMRVSSGQKSWWAGIDAAHQGLQQGKLSLGSKQKHN